MYIILRSCVALILLFLPSSAASADIIAAEEREDVVFMFNTSTNILSVTLGIRDGDTNNFKLGLIAARNISGEMRITITDNAGYAGRVSFVGDLSKGHAWFKITNLNINDTNQYMARLSIEGGNDYMFMKLIVKQQVTTASTVPTTMPVKTSTTTATTTDGISSTQTHHTPTTFQVPPPSSSFPDKNQSSSACTCISIIAACVAIIIFLTLVVVVLLIYIWRLKLNIAKARETRISSGTQDKMLEAYENAHQMKDASVTMTTQQTTRPPNNEKELYETINENKAKGTAAITTNMKATRGPSVSIQGGVPLSQQHYQELQRMTPNLTPLYEPLKQSKFGNKEEMTSSEVPKTYEQLQQRTSGREYQSLKSYKAESESNV